MRIAPSIALGLALAALVTNARAEGDAAAPPTVPAAQPAQSSAWCGAEVEALDHDVCYAAGPHKAARRTLVIFLHGLTDDGAGWQYNMQKGLALAGKRLDFSMLFPRGRNGIGPGKKANQIAWPTGEAARKELENDVIQEWLDAKAAIEAREGAAFDDVFVMGFSNGAYYASSLALRGRLEVDGYAVFAGGSAPKGSVANAKATKNRRPVFVGVATKDETAKKGRELARALDTLSWPHRVDARPVGHTVADGQLDRALEFLRAPEKAASKAADASPAAKKAKPKKAAQRPKKAASKPKSRKK